MKLNIFGQANYGGETFINGVKATKEDLQAFMSGLLSGEVFIKHIETDHENDCLIETF